MILERFKVVDDYIVGLGIYRSGSSRDSIYLEVVTKCGKISTRSYSLSDNNLVKIINKLLSTTSLVDKDDIKFMIVNALSRSEDVKPREIDFFMSKLS